MPLERENRAPNTFCKHGSRSSGEVDARAGSHGDRPSAQAAGLTPERDFDVTSIFAGLKCPLERGSPRSSRDPTSENFENALCVSFFVLFHF